MGGWFRLAAALAAGVAAGPALACAPTSIYFAWGSAEVAPAGRAALEQLAVGLAWKGPDLDHVVLTSHTDTSGAPSANRALALRRAEAVRAILLANAVPAELIELRPLGEAQSALRTPANVREPANRRVDLLLQMSARAQGAQLEEGRPIC